MVEEKLKERENNQKQNQSNVLLNRVTGDDAIFKQLELNKADEIRHLFKLSDGIGQ
jgi:hypothetical protein